MWSVSQFLNYLTKKLKKNNMFETFVCEKRTKKESSRTDTWKNPHKEGKEAREAIRENVAFIMSDRAHSRQCQILLGMDSEWGPCFMHWGSPSLSSRPYKRGLVTTLFSFSSWGRSARYWKQSSYLLSKCSLSQAFHCWTDLVFIRQD